MLNLANEPLPQNLFFVNPNNCSLLPASAFPNSAIPKKRSSTGLYLVLGFGIVLGVLGLIAFGISLFMLTAGSSTRPAFTPILGCLFFGVSSLFSAYSLVKGDLKRFRLKKQGQLLLAKIVQIELKEVIINSTLHKSLEVTYRFEAPDGTTRETVGSAIRDEMTGGTLPALETPVVVLYESASNYMVI